MLNAFYVMFNIGSNTLSNNMSTTTPYEKKEFVFKQLSFHARASMHVLVQKNYSVSGGQHSGTIFRNCSRIFSIRFSIAGPSISKKTCRPSFVRRTTSASYRTAKWREMPELSCGSCLATLWTSFYGKNAYDLLSDGIV